MRKLSFFTTIIFSLVCLYASAQDVKPFNIQLLDPHGSPITDARLIRPSGEEMHPDAEGMIVYKGEDDYVKRNGVYVKTKVMPHYIKIKSASFKEILLDLTKYSLGADIVLTMQRLAPATKKLIVHVLNRKSKPIPDAFISVSPGASASSDEAGNATTTHTQEWGEYITINVSAPGYKTMEKKLMAGQNRVSNGSRIDVKVADDEITFILDKDVETMPLIIEVLDSENDSPVLGAKVELTAKDGTVVTDLTNTSGECKLDVPESSFKGITSRAVVTKTGYEEKWSEVAGELSLIKSEYDRKVVVYIKKKAGEMPKTINECEEGICGKFTLIEGNRYQAEWSNGAKATLTLENFGNGQMLITRGDVGGVSSSMTARYTGNITGNEVKNGKVTWTWNGRTWSGTWTANW